MLLLFGATLRMDVRMHSYEFRIGLCISNFFGEDPNILKNYEERKNHKTIGLGSRKV